MADAISTADKTKLDAAVAAQKAAFAVSEPVEAAKAGGKFREVPESPVSAGASGPLKVRCVSYDGPDGQGTTVESRFTDADGTLFVKCQNLGPETHRDGDWQKVAFPSSKFQVSGEPVEDIKP